MGWRAATTTSSRKSSVRAEMALTSRRRLTGLALLLGTSVLAMGCAAATAIPGQSPSVTISRLTDEPVGLRTAPEVELLAAYELASPDRRFGGFSAIETDGRTLWLLSDRATLWRAAFRLDRVTGALALEDWRVGELLPDEADRRALDSEALALAPDGTLYAAFEHDESVRRLRLEASGDWSTERLHEGRLIEGAPRNQGLEALARLPDGMLVAISEGARLTRDVAAGALLETVEPAEASVRPFGYAVAPGFSPVGAAVAKDRLYVLERSIGLLTGWQSRLTRTPVPPGDDWGTLVGEELIRINAGPLAENHEGVAILDDADGPATILLISDDNQSALQRTLLLVFAYAG